MSPLGPVDGAATGIGPAPVDLAPADRGAPAVRLFNVKFSPNLGDGLLSECLEAGLAHHGLAPGSAYSVDLAARTGYVRGGGGSGLSRRRLLGALSALPGPARRAALGAPLAWARHRTWAPHYRSHLESADAVVIGGGNLFSDIDLNFPTKLAGVLAEATARCLPVAVFGVGVTDRWSRRGHRLVGEALRAADVRSVGVRDEMSLRNFDALFGDAVGCAPGIVRDPGLAVSRFKAFERASGARDVVGVCVTAALAVRYHSDATLSDAFLLDWYAELLRGLVAAGSEVRVFTNGSPEDVEFAGRLRGLDTGARFAPRPPDPDALVRLIGGCTSIVAFRMHAIIAAVSCGVGVVALRWDPKLDAFMASVGLSEFLLSADRARVDEVIDALGRSTARVRDGLDVGALVDDALGDVGALARTLVDATGPHGRRSG